MTETNILDESAVSEIEDRAGDKWTVNTDTIRALCATVKHLRAESFRYKTGFDDYVRKLETDNERLTTGLVNLYHVITNQQCERKVALGMATSAVSSLQSQLEQLRAENEALRKEVANSEKYQAQLLDSDSQAASRGWSSIETAPQNETLLLFAPKERLYSKETIEAQPDLALDEMKVARPRDWTWATHWQRVHPPESNNEH